MSTSSFPTTPSFIPASFAPAVSPDESDVEAELEVDQLDSDSEVDELADPAKPKPPKGGGSRPGERAPGYTLLPAVRLENMIQAEGVTGNLALSKEGLWLVSVATEEFIKRFSQAGHREASAHRRNQINYVDMAATTQQYQEFRFLCDIIPPPVSLADALMFRQDKERELLEDNPALGPMSSSPPWLPTQNWVPPPVEEPPMEYVYEEMKPPKKSRSSNGKDKVNGAASSNSKRTSKKATNGHVADETPPTDVVMTDSSSQHRSDSASQNHRRSGRNGSSSVSASIPPPATNGQTPAGPSRSETPSFSREDSMDSMSHQAPVDYPPTAHSPPYHGQDDPEWTGPSQFTGPASGFLRGSIIPQSRSSQNPGRTIYSQSNPPDR